MRANAGRIIYPLLGVVAATLVRAALQPYVGPLFPFFTYYLVLLISAWYGGLAPGVVAMVAGYLAGSIFYVEPVGSILPQSQATWYGALFYFLNGSVTILLAENQLKARRVAEGAAREAQRLKAEVEERALDLEAVMNAAPAAIWIAHDSEGRRLTGNPAAFRMMGKEAPAGISSWPEPGFPFMHVSVSSGGKEVPLEELPMRKAIFRGAEVRDTEMEIVLHDGTVRQIIGSASPLRDKDGTVRGGVATFVDITEARRHGREVEQLNRRLQRAMAETHHRVKNNLQVVAAMIDMQEMEHGAAIPRSELSRLGVHVRGLATIHDLLTGDAKVFGDVEHVDVRLAFDKLMPSLQASAGGRTVKYAVEPVRVSIRQGTALVILVNELVSNSIKHGDGPIEVTLEMVDSGVRLAVSDHGSGFDIGFDPRTHGNTGLELVENLSGWDLSGRVAYENRPEGGARVLVEFPMDGKAVVAGV